MLPTILLLSSLILSSSVIIIINPLQLGISILLIALLLTITTSLLINSWIAYLIFLIYVRGILVLFSYFVAITPNQHIRIYRIVVWIIALIPVTILLSRLIPPMNTPSTNSLSFTYIQSSSSIILILAIALLITMVIVVKIVILNKGPLRPFNYV